MNRALLFGLCYFLLEQPRRTQATNHSPGCAWTARRNARRCHCMQCKSLPVLQTHLTGGSTPINTSAYSWAAFVQTCVFTAVLPWGELARRSDLTSRVCSPCSAVVLDTALSSRYSCAQSHLLPLGCTCGRAPSCTPLPQQSDDSGREHTSVLPSAVTSCCSPHCNDSAVTLRNAHNLLLNLWTPHRGWDHYFHLDSYRLMQLCSNFRYKQNCCTIASSFIAHLSLIFVVLLQEV